MEHIVFKDKKVILTLPFRKTHQFGDIKPFILHLLPEEEAYLCPVHALADWISASGITSGYLFRRMAASDCPSARDSPMTSEQFLEIFRHNLLNIGIHPSPYGTHSFRRGGYLAHVDRA
ncbi:hypothetical protein BYT27DRAFT_7216811 [Phlegmacium glaucopus]|nr:hypothetical protein BYT27DRAFT_7216811 [Phlegmacium glaucopus]